MDQAMAQVPADDPLMIAWNTYKTTEEFANTKKWAMEAEVRVEHHHTDGSLWAAFEQGYRAGVMASKAPSS